MASIIIALKENFSFSCLIGNIWGGTPFAVDGIHIVHDDAVNYIGDSVDVLMLLLPKNDKVHTMVVRGSQSRKRGVQVDALFETERVDVFLSVRDVSLFVCDKSWCSIEVGRLVGSVGSEVELGAE